MVRCYVVVGAGMPPVVGAGPYSFGSGLPARQPHSTITQMRPTSGLMKASGNVIGGPEGPPIDTAVLQVVRGG